MSLSVDRQNRLGRRVEQCVDDSFALLCLLAGLSALGLINARSDHEFHRAFAHDRAVRPANEQAPAVLGDPVILVLVRRSADDLFEDFLDRRGFLRRQQEPWQPSFRFLRGVAGKLLAYPVELNDSSLAIHNYDQQVLGCIQDRRDNISFLLQRLLILLQRMNIRERHHHPFDFLLTGPERTKPEPVPTASLALNLPAYFAAFLDNCRYQVFQVWNVDAYVEVLDGSADVAREHSKQLLRGRCKTPDMAIAVQNDDGYVDSADYVTQSSERWLSSMLRFCNCSLSVVSSSLLDWSSSLAVSSSSLVL